VINLYIHEDQVKKRQDLSIAKGSKVAVADPFLKHQFELLRGDCEWHSMKNEEAVKKLDKGELDGMVLSKNNDSDYENDDFELLEVDPSLVLLQEVDPEARFANEHVSEEYKKEITDLESDVLKGLKKAFPKSEAAVRVEIGDDKDGHAKNLLKLCVLHKSKTPYYLRLSSGQKEKLLERATDKIKKVRKRKVFITRNVNENDGLKKALEQNGFKVEGKSLVEHKPIPIKKVPDTEWIFFSNVRSAQFFFLDKPDIGKAKIGCQNKQVADTIRKSGHRAAFIGGADSKLVTKQFENVSGARSVCYPKGMRDLRSFQDENQRVKNVDLFVYDTVKHGDFKIPKSDIIVFTSPANVLTFLEQQKITKEKVIAYGDPTMNTLKAKGVVGIFPVHSFDNIGLARSVYNASVG